MLRARSALGFGQNAEGGNDVHAAYGLYARCLRQYALRDLSANQGSAARHDAQQNIQPYNDGTFYISSYVDVDSSYNFSADSDMKVEFDFYEDIYETEVDGFADQDGRILSCGYPGCNTGYGDDFSDAVVQQYSLSPVPVGHEYGLYSDGYAYICYDDGEGDGDCEWDYVGSTPHASVYVPVPPPPPPPAVFSPDACAVTSSPKVGFTSIIPTATPGGAGTLAISFSGSAFANLNPTVAYGPYSTPSSIAANVAALISKKYLQYGLTAKAFGPNIVYGGIATLGSVTNSITGPSFATDASSMAGNTAAAACYALPHFPCLGLYPDYDYTRTNPYPDGSTTPRQHIINKHILGTPTAGPPPNTVYVNPGGYDTDKMFDLIKAYNFTTVLLNPVPINGAFQHTFTTVVIGGFMKGFIGIDAAGNDLHTNKLFLSPDRCRVTTSYSVAP